MGTQLTEGTARRLFKRASDMGRRALSGLTPGMIALVAVLLFARMLSATLEGMVLDAHQHQLGVWFLRLLVGFAMLLVMAVPMLIGVTATANLGPQQGPKRLAALAAAVVVCSGAGLILRIGVQDWLGIDAGWKHIGSLMPYLWPRYAVLCGMLTLAAEFYRREVASTAAAQSAELERAALEREMAEARLQALQAQIEPHFLFNTLANVRRLYDKARGAGRAMLENLMRYLEVALPRMRANTTTLERDAELVEAYLRVHQVRMGQRLHFSIDVPAGLLAHPIPPMMLLTLVENAIKHGLNPSMHGGSLRVSALREDGKLILNVADTGVGFAPGSGGGTGLANIRTRLAAEFGERASLGLQNNELGGVTATLALPLAL